MVAGKHNFVCEQGAAWSRVVTIYQYDGVTPRDLTDYTARMMVRPHLNSDVVWVNIRTGGYGITITGPDGEINLTLTTAQTANLTNTRGGVYDLEIIDSNGEVDRVLEGTFTVIPNVTRTTVESLAGSGSVTSSSAGVVSVS